MSELKLKLKPFTVPNFVIGEGQVASRQEGWAQNPPYPLSYLDSETLLELCNEFKRAVFKKAGLPEPPKD